MPSSALRKAKNCKEGKVNALFGAMWKEDDQKGDCVYSSPRQATLLNCFCIAQFPPDGKLDGKSMKHKAEKHLNHNNKIQTLL